MNFEIPVETFIRLAGVVKRRPDSTESDEHWQALQCVRLENAGGLRFALASNRKVAAIYMLGATQEPDGFVHVTIDKQLLKQCETEKAFNSSLFVTFIPELAIVSLKTTLGYNYPGNGGVFVKNQPLDKWRNWANTETVAASSGAMSWNVEDMIALNSASPSGHIAFPEFIDAEKPVALRDLKVAEWVGLFMANRITDAGKTYTVEPAELPEWWNR